MGKTADTLLPDSKSDGIGFLDRNAGKILFWSIAVSFVLRGVSLLMLPSTEDMNHAKERLENAGDGELNEEEIGVLVMVVFKGMLGGFVVLLAVLVGFFGKLAALIGFIMRGRDRDRRRQAERARRPVAE